MKTFNDAVITVLKDYRVYRAMADEAIANEDPHEGSYAVARTALYNVLLDLFDYDVEAVKRLIEIEK